MLDAWRRAREQTAKGRYEQLIYNSYHYQITKIESSRKNRRAMSKNRRHWLFEIARERMIKKTVVVVAVSGFQ